MDARTVVLNDFLTLFNSWMVYFCRNWAPSEGIVSKLRFEIRNVTLWYELWHKHDVNLFRVWVWASAIERKWMLLTLFILYAVQPRPLERFQLSLYNKFQVNLLMSTLQSPNSIIFCQEEFILSRKFFSGNWPMSGLWFCCDWGADYHIKINILHLKCIMF